MGPSAGHYSFGHPAGTMGYCAPEAGRRRVFLFFFWLAFKGMFLGWQETNLLGFGLDGLGGVCRGVGCFFFGLFVTVCFLSFSFFLCCGVGLGWFSSGLAGRIVLTCCC